MGHNLFYIIHIVVGVLLMHQSFLEMFLLSIYDINPLTIIIILSSILLEIVHDLCECY